MHDDWKPLFDREFNQPYYTELLTFLRHEQVTHQIFPREDQIFRAFSLTSLAATQVVILGQDPYHGAGQANGLAFSVDAHVAFPPSLRNIIKELVSDINVDMPTHGDLSPWATQGVLLLNSTLTVREGEPLSHAGHGWEILTDRVIEYISDNTTACVFVLWGGAAQKKASLINAAAHHTVTSPHPSPLSAHRGFFGSRPFSTVNRLLVESGRTPINWALPGE